jgi:hypothetical protein
LKGRGVLGELKAAGNAGSTGETMGVIFRDDHDDQQDSLMKSIAIGNTWQFRIFRIKAFAWGTVASALTGTACFALDYAVYKFSDSPNLLAWLWG